MKPGVLYSWATKRDDVYGYRMGRALAGCVRGRWLVWPFAGDPLIAVRCHSEADALAFLVGLNTEAP